MDEREEIDCIRDLGFNTRKERNKIFWVFWIYYTCDTKGNKYDSIYTVKANKTNKER